MRLLMPAFVVSLLCPAMPLAQTARLAIYQSEENAKEYHGIHQGHLPNWLKEHGLTFDVIGDEVAGDPAALAKYDLILATSAYLIPDAACEGLVRYVEQGGHLLWIDSPARTRHAGLRAVLGVEAASTYAPLHEVAFTLDDPEHPVCAGVDPWKAQDAVGNPATQAAENVAVLATWRGTARGEQPTEVTFPAIVFAHTGRGSALLYNWLLWLDRGTQGRALLANGIDLLLAQKTLAEHPALLRAALDRSEVRQPEPIRVRLKVLARQALAGQEAEVTLKVAGGPTGARKTRLPLKRAGDSNLALGTATVEIPTRAENDANWQLSAAGELGTLKLGPVSLTATLCGQLAARLAKEERARYDLLKPLLQGTLGDYDAEPRTEDGQVDIPRLMQMIQGAHMNMYDWLIWHSPNDWEDLHKFLPVARQHGIKVWVTLCPPSEQGGNWPWSEPYRLDFIRWAAEIGKLSQQYDNLVALVIDDFWSGGNHQLFTPDYIAKLAATLRAQNPRVAFLPTIYWRTIGDEQWMEEYHASIDGIVFPYAELETGDQLAEQLRACRDWIGPHKFLLMNVYASGSSGSGQKGPRTPEYMRKVLTISRQMCDGIRIYCLPKGKMQEDYRYAITAELYEKWSKESR